MEVDAKTIAAVIGALVMGAGGGGMGGWKAQESQMDKQRAACERVLTMAQEGYRHSLELIVENVRRE